MLMLAVTMASCGIFNETTSRFSGNVALGIDEKEFVSRFGKPYAQEMFYDADNRPNERLLYREEVSQGGGNYYVTTAFLFVNSKLVDQQVVRDEKAYDNGSLDTNNNNSGNK